MFSQIKRPKMNEEPSIMSVEGGVENVTASKIVGVVANNVPPSVTVALHPLVIMNISDHYTRIKAQEGTIPKGKIV